MAPTNPALLEKINAHSPGYQRSALRFEQRLARDNGWTDEYSLRVVTEYKRFVYLAMTLGHPVTPSDQVDQAWHLHLTYTRDYWDVFCAEVLEKPFHHEPTQGDESERIKFFNWYAQTLTAYRNIFGEPPQDIWPTTAIRFQQQFQRLELRQIIPGQIHRIWIAGLAGALGMVGVAWAGEETSRHHWVWLTLLGLIAVVALGLWAFKANSGKKHKGSGCGGGGCGGGHGGCGGGGCGGCGG